MPAPLSIIIPALNAARDLPLCLESLLPGLEAGLIREVIVADAGSSDATRTIAGSAGASVVEAGADPLARMKAGIEAARSDWFLLLPPETALSRGWPERVEAHIESRPEMAAVFRLKLRSDLRAARAIEARTNRTARWFGLPASEQGLLLPRALYQEIASLTEASDRPIADLARKAGKKRLVMLDAEARASAARYEERGWRSVARRDAARLVSILMGAKS